MCHHQSSVNKWLQLGCAFPPPDILFYDPEIREEVSSRLMPSKTLKFGLRCHSGSAETHKLKCEGLKRLMQLIWISRFKRARVVMLWSEDCDWPWFLCLVWCSVCLVWSCGGVTAVCGVYLCVGVIYACAQRWHCVLAWSRFCRELCFGVISVLSRTVFWRDLGFVDRELCFGVILVLSWTVFRCDICNVWRDLCDLCIWLVIHVFS